MKLRLSSILLIWAVLFCVVVAGLSTFILNLIMSQEVDDGVREAYIGGLEQIAISMEDNFHNLSTFSYHFTPYSGIGEQISTYYSTEEIYEKKTSREAIINELGILLFVNHNISLGALYNTLNMQDILSNHLLEGGVELMDGEMLLQQNQISYFLPKQSITTYSNRPVLSSIYEYRLTGASEQIIKVYAETSFENTQRLMESTLFPEQMTLLMLNEDMQVILSENEELYSIGTELNILSKEQFGETESFTYYQSINNQGWRFVGIIDNADSNAIKMAQMLKYLAVFPVFMLIAVIFCFIVYHLVNLPLREFYYGIAHLEQGDFSTTIPYTGLYEIDTLNGQINRAKATINNLIQDVKKSEKQRSEAQISKLRSQINPHFLLNTLNTLRWCALSSGEQQITNITTDLTKMLSYNLRNDKSTATLGQELDVTETYLRLQQNRIDFTYRLVNNCGDAVLEMTIPRFILQPLVENSILHSKTEALHIEIQLEATEHNILLHVIDNGGGTSPEQLDKLNALNYQPGNSSIGVAFVVMAMNEHYNKTGYVSFANNDIGGMTVTMTLL